MSGNSSIQPNTSNTFIPSIHPYPTLKEDRPDDRYRRLLKRKREEWWVPPKPSISDFHCQLMLLHDSIMNQIFSPQSDMENSGGSVDNTHKKMIRFLHAMRIVQWKIRCCMEAYTYSYIQNNIPTYADGEWRFMSKLQLNFHEMKFVQNDANLETVDVTLPYMDDHDLVDADFQPIQLGLRYSFRPFFVDPGDVDHRETFTNEWVIVEERRKQNDLTLLTSNNGKVIILDEKRWEEIRCEIGLDNYATSITFIIRFLGRLCSYNGRNPAADIDQRNQYRNDAFGDQMVSDRHYRHYPFLTEWWDRRRNLLFWELNDLNISALIPDLIAMILDHAYELAPLSLSNSVTDNENTNTHCQTILEWQPP